MHKFWKRGYRLIVALLIPILVANCGLLPRWLQFGSHATLEKANGVDIPVDLDEIRKLDNPPETVVTVAVVKEQFQPGGGGGCHDLVVCLIYIPILAYAGYKHFFPDTHLSVTIKKRDQIVYSAKFSDDERFLSATSFSDTAQKEFLVYDLENIGRKIVFQIAQGTPGKNDLRPVKIAGQIDLANLSDTALSKSKDPEKRGKILSEMLLWFGVEATEIAYEKLRSKQEPDLAKVELVHTFCNNRDLDPNLFWTRQIDSQTDVATATAALFCLAPQDQAVSDWPAWSEALVRYVCSDKFEENDRADALKSLVALPKEKADTIKAAGLSVYQQCDSSPFKTTIGLMLGQPITPEEMAQVLNNSRLHDFSLGLIESRKEFAKNSMIELFKLPEPHLSSQVTKFLMTYDSKPWATFEELEAIARALAQAGWFSDYIKQDLLTIFYLHRNAVDAAAFRNVLQKLQSEAANRNKPDFDLALYIFGDPSKRIKILEFLAGPASKHRPTHVVPGLEPKSLFGVTINSLLLWGCHENEIEEALKTLTIRRLPGDVLPPVQLSCLPEQ